VAAREGVPESEVTAMNFGLSGTAFLVVDFLFRLSPSGSVLILSMLLGGAMFGGLFLSMTGVDIISCNFRGGAGARGRGGASWSSVLTLGESHVVDGVVGA
jgi:hypothetical protein